MKKSILSEEAKAGMTIFVLLLTVLALLIGLLIIALSTEKKEPFKTHTLDIMIMGSSKVLVDFDGTAKSLYIHNAEIEYDDDAPQNRAVIKEHSESFIPQPLEVEKLILNPTFPLTESHKEGR